MVAPEKAESFMRLLLSWAKENNKTYPWRKTRDPYRVLVAEIMLQRTKAEQVVRIYEKFLKQYPTPQHVANAPVEGIAAHIESLGLKKRAEVFKKVAYQIVNEHACRIPKEREQLLSLYGVGNYIADAVRCHAYGVDVLTVDANLARVFKRVFSLRTRTIPQKDSRIRSFADEIVQYAANHCRELNLAIIDLANLICLPKKPKCPDCPLNSICDYAKAEYPTLGQAIA
jgi:A/G-specific adenine glycosylase